MLTSLLCQTPGLAAGLGPCRILPEPGDSLGTPGTHQVCMKWLRILNWGCCPAPRRDGWYIFSSLPSHWQAPCSDHLALAWAAAPSLGAEGHPGSSQVPASGSSQVPAPGSAAAGHCKALHWCLKQECFPLAGDPLTGMLPDLLPLHVPLVGCARGSGYFLKVHLEQNCS